MWPENLNFMPVSARVRSQTQLICRQTDIIGQIRRRIYTRTHVEGNQRAVNELTARSSIFVGSKISPDHFIDIDSHKHQRSTPLYTPHLNYIQFYLLRSKMQSLFVLLIFLIAIFVTSFNPLPFLSRPDYDVHKHATTTLASTPSDDSPSDSSDDR